MNRCPPLARFATPMLAFTASCFLDTAPILSPVNEDAGSAADSGVPDWQPMQTQPAAASDASTNTATTSTSMTMTMSMDSGAGVVAAPDAGATSARPPVTQPSATSVPANTSNTSPIAHCDGVGSYGLHATIDVTWDATDWSDVGRGSVELYGVVDVEAIDPQTHAASASFRACGLILPTLNSNAMCSSYQLQFPKTTWDGAQLPAYELEGSSYDCTASDCALKFAPVHYTLGIRLPDPQGPWPAFKNTAVSQFADDDADGFAGVSVDVVSLASQQPNQTPQMPGQMGMGQTPGAPSQTPNQTACAPTGWPAGPTNPMGQSQMPQMPTELGRLLLGLRTQLTAAMQLDANCALSEITATDATLDLRSAGCFVTDGTDPASATLGCSEELREGFDQTLPDYEPLEEDEAPKGRSIQDKRPSAGTVLQAVRFAKGTAAVSCEQVRSAMMP